MSITRCSEQDEGEQPQTSEWSHVIPPGSTWLALDFGLGWVRIIDKRCFRSSLWHGRDAAPHWGYSAWQRGMDGELATSVAPGTSILPVQEMEDEKNPQNRHRRCILIIPGTCNTGCEVFCHISIRKMLREKTPATDTLKITYGSAQGFSSCRILSQPYGRWGERWCPSFNGGCGSVKLLFPARLVLWNLSEAAGEAKPIWPILLQGNIYPVPEEAERAEDRKRRGEGRKMHPSPAFKLAVAHH